MKRLSGARTLILVLVVDLVLQALGIWRSWDANTFLMVPAGDGKAAWQEAARLAAGGFVGETPFLSAPLHLWFLGLLRACGFGLLGVYAVHLLLRAATAWLIARLATRAWPAAGGGAAGAEAAGLIAALLFLLWREPAYYALRLLNPSLQLLLVAAALLQAIRFHERPGRDRAAVLGLVYGLALLANPVLLIGAPVLLVWAWSRAERTLPAPLLLGAALALTLAPATIHNALSTSRHPPGQAELILVSAQAGVTFAHGYGDGADGTYRPLEGVSAGRLAQNRDAYRLAAEAGEGAGWKHTSSFFAARTWGWIAEHPGAALALFWRKLLWFFAGTEYGDLHVLGLEFDDPTWPRPLLLPAGSLRLVWFLPTGLLGLWLLSRRARGFAVPWLVFGLVPLLTVLLFWFSPRYRLPIAPLVAALTPIGAAWLGARCGGGSTRLGLALFAPGLLIAGTAQLAGFDAVAPYRPAYQRSVGMLEKERGREELAVERFRAAAAGGVSDPAFHAAFADTLVQRGTAALEADDEVAAAELYDEALPHYRSFLDDPELGPNGVFSLINVLAFLAGMAEDRADDEARRRYLEEARTRGTTALAAAEERGDRARAATLRQLLSALPQD